MSFWLGVCDDLKSRGVEDILIICKDGLSGFSEAVKAVFPKTDYYISDYLFEELSDMKKLPVMLQSIMDADDWRSSQRRACGTT